jgi:hypothetical protein
MFPQLPFSYIDNTDFCFAKLITKNYAERDNGVFLRLLNRNYGLINNTSTNLNDKILAYWKFNAKVEREYDEFASIADFVIDEVSDPSFNLALHADSAFSFITGLIGNCLGNFADNRAELNTAYGANLTALNPESNGFNFIGIGVWVKTFVSEGLSADQEFGQQVYDFGKFNLSVKVFTNTPLEYYLSIGNNYDSGSPSIDSADLAADIANWNLVIVEINRAALTFSIRINTGTATTLSYTEDSTGFTSGVIGNNTSSDILVAIDEGFAFNAPLTEDDIANIYNSGIGATYPF